MSEKLPKYQHSKRQQPAAHFSEPPPKDYGATVTCMALGGVFLGAFTVSEIAGNLVLPYIGFEAQAHDFVEAAKYTLIPTVLCAAGAVVNYVKPNR